ncbi:MAG: NAD(P)-dependent alcohol dehydrogenase [Imperialibacter sp.]|uniref:NAD(P)-dependent alcohol dehydrogenase n=1 Tax=Imperialibacter sp. TaxID=2038411 RepID=UPI0032EED50B
MKAANWTNYGPPEMLKLTEREKPTAKDNEVLIKVMAATINRTDCAMLRAKPFFMRLVTGLSKPGKPSTGTDLAGEVVAVGEAVKSFEPGDRVFAFEDLGLSSHAEYTTFPADKAICTIPDNFSFADAAACVEGAHYAYYFLDKVNLQAGQKVLVNGATGAIGSATVQLCKYHGAVVTAVCQGKDFELLRSLGADKLIDYTREDFTKIDQQFDYIFDAVGKSSFGKCKRLLKPGGVYMSSELGRNGENILYSLLTPLFSKKKVKFPIPLDKKKSLFFIRQMMAEGKLKPVIDRQYKLEQLVEAFNYVETGQKTGNVILLPSA